ncbi:Thiol-disulfide isomerase or thioredoxin [bacterium A37T11]|nr:Thiol-disulfide isomerase or thioredoxin [bacterium A37T11]
MKNYSILVLLLLPVFIQAQQASYTVKGKIGSINAPAKIYLVHGEKPSSKVDTAVIQNGQFLFEGSILEPQAVTLTLSYEGTGAFLGPGKREFFNFYLEPGSIQLESPDSLIHASIRGSNVNADNEKLKTAIRQNVRHMQQDMAVYKTFSPERIKDKTIMEKMDSTMHVFNSKEHQIYLDFILQHPNSFVSLDVLKYISGTSPDYPKTAPLFYGLAKAIRLTPSGKSYDQLLKGMKATAVGQMAPDFVQNDPSGHPIRLSALRGQYVLVDFWASWCVPCRAENPNLVNAYKKYHGKGLEILSVSSDDQNGKKSWLAAIQKDGLIWKNVSDLKGRKNAAAALYSIKAIPQNVLLDKTGKIIAKNLRGDALTKKLEELFE